MKNKATILLVEDESPAVFAIEKYFNNAGYQVTTAFSAPEGLKAALETHPDVIILDVMMPTSSGLDMLPELRGDSWGQNAKVIVFSNLSGDEYKVTANKFHVDKYLVKTDTSLKELEDNILQVLPNHDQP